MKYLLKGILYLIVGAIIGVILAPLAFIELIMEIGGRSADKSIIRKLLDRFKIK